MSTTLPLEQGHHLCTSLREEKRAGSAASIAGSRSSAERRACNRSHSIWATPLPPSFPLLVFHSTPNTLFSSATRPVDCPLSISDRRVKLWCSRWTTGLPWPILIGPANESLSRHTISGRLSSEDLLPIMAVQRGPRKGNTQSMLYLQKELPSPPPKYVEIHDRERIRSTAKTTTLRPQSVQRSSTAPSTLPSFTKSPTIKRNYHYSPITTVSITRVSASPERVQVVTRPPVQKVPRVQRSRTLSVEKPLPPMPPLEETVAMKDSSSIESKGESKSSSSTPPTSVDEVKLPEDDPMTADFKGDISTTNSLPTKAILDSAADLPVLDPNGQSIPFKSLYWPRTMKEEQQGKRVMVIFIRHFFCGVSSVASP